MANPDQTQPMLDTIFNKIQKELEQVKIKTEEFDTLQP